MNDNQKTDTTTHVPHVGPKDKCPCGSGRKYKKCCGIGIHPRFAERREDNYILIRKTEDSLFTKTTGFVLSLGEEVFHDAVATFVEGIDQHLDPQGEYASAIYQMMNSWMLFDWPIFSPIDSDEEKPLDARAMTIAELYMKAYADDPALAKRELRIHDNEMALVKAGAETRFSWYMVEDLKPGSTMLLRNLFDDSTVDVYEHSGSQEEFMVGCCVLARVVTLYGINFLLGCFPFPLPPRDMNLLLKAREEIQERVEQIMLENADDDANMSEFFARDIAIRTSFIEAVFARDVSSFSPSMLRNTDGDLIQAYNISFIFKEGCEGDARKKLVPLLKEVPDLKEEELLNLEKYPLSFPWCRKGNKMHQEWDNTVIGMCRLTEDRLVISVHSKERREKARRKIKSLLKDDLERTFSEQVSLEEGFEPLNTPIPDDPEVRAEIEAQMSTMLDSYYEDWASQEIPALDGMTPLEAAKTPHGRELLHALFHDYEAHSKSSNESDDPLLLISKPDVNILKAKVGMLDECQ